MCAGPLTKNLRAMDLQFAHRIMLRSSASLDVCWDELTNMNAQSKFDAFSGAFIMTSTVWKTLPAAHGIMANRRVKDSGFREREARIELEKEWKRACAGARCLFKLNDKHTLDESNGRDQVVIEWRLTESCGLQARKQWPGHRGKGREARNNQPKYTSKNRTDRIAWSECSTFIPTSTTSGSVWNSITFCSKIEILEAITRVNDDENDKKSTNVAARALNKGNSC